MTTRDQKCCRSWVQGSQAMQCDAGGVRQSDSVSLEQRHAALARPGVGGGGDDCWHAGADIEKGACVDPGFPGETL